MSTIPTLKTANNTVIRTEAAVGGISRDKVADILDNYADELLARGIGVVDTTGDLASFAATDHVIAIVKNYGIFIDSASGPANGDTIFAGSGGRFWLLVVRTSPTNLTVGSGTYTPTSTDSNVASKTWQLTHYMRIGNEVHLNSGVLVAATATGAVTMDFTLPIASTFTTSTDAAGVVEDSDGVTLVKTIAANVGTTIRLAFTAVDTSSHVIRFSLIYTIKP